MSRATNAPAGGLTARLRPALAWSTTLIVALATMVLLPATPAFAAESMTLVKSSTANALVGGAVDVTLRASNTGTDPLYNLSFRDQLPAGVTYVPGSTKPVQFGDPVIATDVPSGRQTLVWRNVSDLPLDASQSLDFKMATDPVKLPVGSTFSNVATAYANGNNRLVPDFDAAGSYTGDASVQISSAPAATKISAIRIRKSEPSPEGELLRGIHAHSTVYTLTVTNNSQNDDDSVVVVDHLPAQLEFLGCGTTDNTSGTNVEYTGAPRLDASTPDVPGCTGSQVPKSIDTVTDPSGLPAGVYTKVQWDLGTLTPGQKVEINYRAGIPQRANVVFPVDGPTAASLEQGANLDNNTGTSTREALVVKQLTNHATVSATYDGPVATGASTTVGDAHNLTVTAEDLALQKAVTPGNFTHGGIATYTLDLQAGEYADATGIVITDVLPNGLCPLGGAGENWATGDPTECEGSAATAPSVPFTAVENGNGTFTLTFSAIDLAASKTTTVTYQARMLDSYRGGVSAPTVAGDSYTNTATLTATTTTLAAVNPPGGVTAATVKDASSATIVSGAVLLDKQIQPNAGPKPHTCATTETGYADADTLTAAETAFSEGSRVCFLLRVDFPSGNETKNPELADFLPDYLTYESGSAQALAGNEVTTAFDAATLTFTLGDSATAGGDRFVPRGKTFLWRISGIVNDAPLTQPEVAGNLAKLQWVNTAGAVSFLRDQEDFAVAPAPPVSVVKSANRVTASAPGVPGNLPDGGSSLAQRIRGGDVVDFTVAVRNNGTAALSTDRDVIGPDVWDRLPRSITCADVSNISAGGICTDPGAATHPTFSDRTTRSAIRWDRPDTVTIAPAATLALTYRVTYPSTIATNRSYVNNAAVASYASSSNVGTLVAHHPQSNVDTTVTAAQMDVPAAADGHTLLAPDAAVTKTNVTQVADATQGSTASVHYAAIGETVTYTVTGTIPALTTVYGGVLYDTTPAGIRVDAAVFEYRAAPGDPWTTSLPLGFTATTPPAAPRVDFPASHDAGAEDDAVRITITATVVTHASNIHAAVRTNTARLTSQTEYGSALTTRTGSSAITVVEPAPSPTKQVNNTMPVAGQTVRYTVTARNVNPSSLDAMRPPLFESVLVDCVPTGLTLDPASVTPSTGTATVAAVGSNGCAADRTPIVWQVDDLAWRNAAAAAGASPWPTLQYDAEVAPAAAGAKSYTNTVSLTGTSMDGADADEKTYTGTTDRTVTVPSADLTKTVTPLKVPVGGVATYDLGITLPASVNFYEATVVDTLPSGITPGVGRADRLHLHVHRRPRGHLLRPRHGRRQTDPVGAGARLVAR